MNIVKKAIKQNEIVQLLEGKGEYMLENNSMASISAPIDWTIVIPQLYNEYAHNSNVMTMYCNAIKEMLMGNAEEVYCAVAVLYFQTLREESNSSPFRINRESFIPMVSEALKSKANELKKIKKWAGTNAEDGLWSEVNRYKRLFESKFDIIL